MTISIRTYIITCLAVLALLYAGVTFAQKAVANSETSQTLEQVFEQSEPDLMTLVSGTKQARGVEAVKADCESPQSPKCTGRFQAH